MHRGSGAPLPLPSAADSLVASGPLPRTRRPRARSERALIRGALAGSEAEDIAQEAFVQAIRRLDRFDRRRRFAPWLGAIVANRAIDWLRARTARRESGQEPPESAVAADPPAGAYSEEVLMALAELSPEHRAVVVMRYVLEYTPGEIAQALDLPRGTVNSRLRRGLDVLESRLEKAQLA